MFNSGKDGYNIAALPHFMLKPSLSLAQVVENLRSARPGVRVYAIQELLLLAKLEGSARPAALGIFRAAILTEKEPWVAITAARGIDFLAGAEEGRNAWLSLLHHPKLEMVVSAALAIPDRSYAEELKELMERRSETRIRCAALDTLGRLQDAAFLPLIVERLRVPELRRAAIEALANLGDPQAIPHLEPFFNDLTPDVQLDERGATLRICDLADAAIRRLCVNPMTKSPFPSGGVLSEEVMRAQSVPPVAFPADVTAKLKIPTIVWVPLAALILEIPWIVAALFAQIFMAGSIPKDAAGLHRLDLLAMIPALVGVVVGLTVFARGIARQFVEKIYLWVSSLGCGIFVFSFALKFFH